MLAAAAAFAAVHMIMTRTEKKETASAGRYAVARLAGEEWGRWSLGEDQVIEIDTDYGHNELTIRDGAAFMTEADCPDKYCMEMGKAVNPGSTIVCLPHRLVIEIVRENASGSEISDSSLTPDAVAK